MALNYRRTFEMHSHETAFGGRLTVAALCNYLQEVAAEHAARLGFGTAHFSPLGQAWVLRRLRMELTSLPSSPELVTVHTWPSGSEGARATREFVVSGSSCGEFARATSIWILMDLERRRPARIPPLLRRLEPLNKERAVDLHEPPIPPETHKTADERTVQPSDLDANGHVNNVRIASWIVDSAQLKESSELRGMDIVFRKEVLPGRVVRIHVMRSEGASRFRHGLTTVEDGLLAVAETVWTD